MKEARLDRERLRPWCRSDRVSADIDQRLPIGRAPHCINGQALAPLLCSITGWGLARKIVASAQTLHPTGRHSAHCSPYSRMADSFQKGDESNLTSMACHAAFI